MSKIEAYTSKKIIVNCENNDSVDVKCGGPYVLGFDFFVDSDENTENMIEFIKKELKNEGLPLQSIYCENIIIPVKVLWTKEMISNCIKVGY